MTSSELLELFRLDVEDTAEPYLWSDAELYSFMDDAQKWFCRLTGGLGDASTPTMTQIAVTVGTEWYPRSDLILKVREAYRVADGRPVSIMNYEDLVTRGIRLNGRTGRVDTLIIGMEEGSYRVYPAPNQADTIQLLVDRLPLKRITEGDQKFEIAEHHHQHLMLWMKYRAYLKQDAETYDRAASERNQAGFHSYCEVAKAEKGRANHKTRVVAYGGI